MGRLTEDMQRLVREQRLGFVATVCPDGTPNLSPKGTLSVWDDDHLVFADICSPGTLRNMEQNPAMEINVVDPIARKGYRFKGTARVVREGPQFEALIASFRARNLPYPINAVVLLAVERALPLLSPVYDTGATEAEVRRTWRAYYSQIADAAEATTPSPSP